MDTSATEERPAAAPETSIQPQARAPEPSSRSADLAVYYRNLQADLLAQGLLRTDGGGPDTPFTDAMLARNFEQIALYDEYVTGATQIRAETTESLLRRWSIPVKFAVEFGDGVPEDVRAGALEDVKRYADRLARITGHPISYDENGANFHALVLTEDDRADIAPRLRELAPGIGNELVRFFQDADRRFLCLVVAFSSGGSSNYTRAIALIRAEHPDLLRRTCIHEELAQGLGLANDSPSARPSIFNDDEEFGLLTTHDEHLLRILYDDRLEAGMTAAEARPIVAEIAAELVGSGR